MSHSELDLSRKYDSTSVYWCAKYIQINVKGIGFGMMGNAEEWACASWVSPGTRPSHLPELVKETFSTWEYLMEVKD